MAVPPRTHFRPDKKIRTGVITADIAAKAPSNAILRLRLDRKILMTSGVIGAIVTETGPGGDISGTEPEPEVLEGSVVTFTCRPRTS